MHADPLWLRVAKQAVNFVQKLKTPSSCANTADALQQAYQHQTNQGEIFQVYKYRVKHEDDDDNEDHDDDENNRILIPVKDYYAFTRQFRLEKKNAFDHAKYIKIRFDVPPDHWITFIYDEVNDVWILLQSWQDLFTLREWIACPLIQIAKEVKTHLQKNNRKSNPIQNLTDYSKCFWLSWLKQVQTEKYVHLDLKKTDQYFKDFFQATPEQFHDKRVIIELDCYMK